MTPEQKEEDRKFIQREINSLDGPIRQHTILLKAYEAGGDLLKEQKDKVAALLGAQIAARDVFIQELKNLDQD